MSVKCYSRTVGELGWDATDLQHQNYLFCSSELSPFLVALAAYELPPFNALSFHCLAIGMLFCDESDTTVNPYKISVQFRKVGAS